MQATCLLTVDPLLIVKPKALSRYGILYMIIKKCSAYVKRMKSFGGNKRLIMQKEKRLTKFIFCSIFEIK